MSASFFIFGSHTSSKRVVMCMNDLPQGQYEIMLTGVNGKYLEQYKQDILHLLAHDIADLGSPRFGRHFKDAGKTLWP